MRTRLACVLGLLLATSIVRADRVELLNGVRVEGRIVSQGAEVVVIEAFMGGGKARMRFPMSKVHALTVGAERKVVHEKGSAPAPPKPTTSKPKASEPETASGRTTRSRSEVDALINKAGATPPDWWDSVPLDYPKTLDLSWPDKPPGGWNQSKNVGQYLFSVINENPSRWKSGVRFLHYLLTVHKNDSRKLVKVMAALGEKYFMLLGDPARAAFWYRKAHARE
ncbi:hypothetical protein HQ560_06795, partial [bacterium]|nr:hypothetical protein [bacterium]